MKRGYIVLIAAGMLFAVGVAISAVWGVEFAGAFLRDNTIVAKTSIEVGQSVDARTDVSQIDRPISLAIGVDKAGQASSEIKLREIITDPNGKVVSSNEFGDSFFTSFKPEVNGVYTATMSNLGTRPVTISGAFGYMSFIGSDGKPDIDNMMSASRGFGMVFAGMGLIAAAIIALVVGVVVLVVDNRNRQNTTTPNEGGVTYRKD